ncbi:MAG TPA: nucleotide sugar dehydrogenase [Puia sp.]|jgi:UDP-N-acetyl-D-galactosamine dehydrogenase|nr:nucleotide sugar dehydrogenase [Puia sp.]
MESKHQIAIIGLGYVGLPLAVEFAKKYSVVGFDINSNRVNELMRGYDHTQEIEESQLKKVLSANSGIQGLFCSDDITDIRSCNYFIVTVPTPIDKQKSPDLSLLFKASETLGTVIKRGDIVIYESTVYPGVTEEECAPLLEKTSGLKFNIDFFCGYSPERINPGDKEHSVANILKITSGSTNETAKTVDELYRSVIVAGTYMAPSIRVAEAAKLIENSQRDINVAFVNELAKIFNLIGIDTNEVLEAAGTKWNFLKFKPGLVGGHCIGVGSYYLARKAEEAGYRPEVILAGRRLNDSMGAYVASETIKLMIKKEIPVKNASILIMGFTFKENCNDIRNTRVIDIVEELKSYQAKVSIFDPRANPEFVNHEYGIQSLNVLSDNQEKYDAVILAVAHIEFNKLNIIDLVKKRSVIYDVKGVLSRNCIDARL